MKLINRQFAQEYIQRRYPLAEKNHEVALIGWLIAASIMLPDNTVDWWYDEEKDELKYRPIKRRKSGNR